MKITGTAAVAMVTADRQMDATVVDVWSLTLLQDNFHVIGMSTDKVQLQEEVKRMEECIVGDVLWLELLVVTDTVARKMVQTASHALYWIVKLVLDMLKICTKT